MVFFLINVWGGKVNWKGKKKTQNKTFVKSIKITKTVLGLPCFFSKKSLKIFKVEISPLTFVILVSCENKGGFFIFNFIVVWVRWEEKLKNFPFFKSFAAFALY